MSFQDDADVAEIKETLQDEGAKGIGCILTLPSSAA